MEITLLFSEPVNISTFDVSELRLQSLFQNPVSNFTPNASLSVSVDNRYVRFVLSDYDLIRIKHDSYLCSLRSNCYVWVSPLLVTDLAGNALSNISNIDPGMLVTNLIADNQPANIEDLLLIWMQHSHADI